MPDPADYAALVEAVEDLLGDDANILNYPVTGQLRKWLDGEFTLVPAATLTALAKAVMPFDDDEDSAPIDATQGAAATVSESEGVTIGTPDHPGTAIEYHARFGPLTITFHRGHDGTCAFTDNMTGVLGAGENERAAWLTYCESVTHWGWIEQDIKRAEERRRRKRPNEGGESE